MAVSDKTSETKKPGRHILARRIEILILAALLWLFFVFAGRALCKAAISQISELTNTKITTSSVVFKLNGSVVIKGLKVRPEKRQTYDDTILRADKVYVRFSLFSLLLRNPQLKKITIRDFVFNAQQDVDTGYWNLSDVKINLLQKNDQGKIPSVHIHLKEGKLQYSKVSDGLVKTIAAVPIDARFRPAKAIIGGYSFNITTAKRHDLDKSTLFGFWRPGRIEIGGSISSSDLPAFERKWWINALDVKLAYDENNTYSLQLKMADTQFKHTPIPEMPIFAKPPFLQKFAAVAALQRFFDRYDPKGQVDVELEAQGDLTQLSKSSLHGQVNCDSISIIDSRFPYFMDDITGKIDFTEKNVTLNSLQGTHNTVELTIDGHIEGYGPNRRSQVQITSDNMILDDDLYNALNEKQKQLWSTFSPGGIAKIDYLIDRKTQTDIRKRLEIYLQGANAVYTHFPYPLQNLTGKLSFEKGGVTVSNLVSQAGKQKIILNGQMTAADANKPIYDILIEAKGIPLNAKLKNLLPAEQKQLLEKQFEIINRYGEGAISLNGRIWTEKHEEKPNYQLLLGTENLEINDELFELLPTESRKFVTGLNPKGKINYSIDLNKASSDKQFDYMVLVDLLGNSINFAPFPYPLKDITGNLKIRTNNIKLEDITASTADSVHIAPGSSKITLNGQIFLVDNTFSNALFSLYASDILLDERLGLALPEDIEPFYSNLSPTGRFDLNLENVAIFTSDEGEKYIDFEGFARFDACNFNTTPAITELDAIFKTKGLYKTGVGLSDGQITIIADGVRISKRFFNDLRAELHYDSVEHDWLTENLRANCYNGKLAGKFELKLPEEGGLKYLLQIGFDNIDLQEFLLEGKYKQISSETTEVTKPIEASHIEPSSGKLAGFLSLTGRFNDSQSRIGRCRLLITDMKAGKRSQVAKVLRELEVTEAKDFAFEQMLVDSYIKADQLLLNHIDLSGEALAFNGSGRLNLKNQNIDVTLTARGERIANVEPSIFQSLTEGLGEGVVRIDVTGNFNNPEIKTKALPALKEAAGLLGTKPSKHK